jgi:hypothetical protein
MACAAAIHTNLRRHDFCRLLGQTEYIPHIFIWTLRYRHVFWWLIDGVWMVNRFIQHSQVVTTNNYNTKYCCNCNTYKCSTSACLVTLQLCNTWPMSLEFSYYSVQLTASRVESYVTTDNLSASLSWNKAPILGLRPDFYYCQTVAGLLICGALSDERTGL